MKTLENSPFAFRVADLPTKKPTRFKILPNSPQREEIARALGLVAVKKLNFEGEITPKGKRDWRLTAKLGSSVTQSCVVSLKPVNTRIDTTISRDFVREASAPTGDEFEMPEDDNIEELGEFIDPYFVMQEALTIAIPDYPRAENAEIEESVFTKPGQKAMTDEEAKPFAALAGLMKQVENPENEG